MLAAACQDPKQKMGVSQIRGTLFRGPYNKDYSIFGSILGSPYFGKLPDLALLESDWHEMHEMVVWHETKC